MRPYEFAIVASGLDPQDEDFEARFYRAGCDDATISFQRCRIIADFARKAGSPAEAVVSAIEDVMKAGAAVERVEPDPLVSLTDMASRAALTRAALSLYARGQRARGFPPPVARVTTSSPLWDWAEVSRWLCDHGKLDQEEVALAQLVKAANEAVTAGEVAHLRARLGAIVRKVAPALIETD